MADASVRIEVKDYSALENAINQYNTCRDALQQTVEQMRKAVYALNTTWNGSASEASVNKFVSIHGNLLTQEEPLEKVIDGLTNALNEYKSTESAAEQAFKGVEMAQNPFGA